MASSKRVVLIGTALVALGVIVFAACGGDDGPSQAETQEFEDTVRQLVGSGPEDVDFFLDHVTDKVLEEFFGYTRDGCRENVDDCVGDPGTLESLSNTDISGDEAATDVSITDFGEFRVTFVREDDTWKFDTLDALSKEIPEGVQAVSLGVSEYTFALNAEDITDGNIAFQVSNVGQQPHEVILSKVPADLDIEEAIMSEEEPEGVEDIASWGPVRPGNEGNVVLDAPLEAGRYVLLCFLPDLDDPERTPHAIKGMFTEFTIP